MEYSVKSEYIKKMAKKGKSDTTKWLSPDAKKEIRFRSGFSSTAKYKIPEIQITPLIHSTFRPRIFISEASQVRHLEGGGETKGSTVVLVLFGRKAKQISIPWKASMAREKGAPPLRRLPSRSGRASFEADPNGQEDADTSSSPPFSSATTTKNISGVGGSEVEQEGKEAAQGPFEEYRKPSVSNGILTGRHAVNDAQGATSAAAVTTTAVPTSASRATTPVTPRCLGRPKKKPLKVKVDDTDNSASTPRVVTVGMPRSSADSTASISTAVAGVPTTSVATAAAEVNGAKLVNAHGASINDTSSGGDKTGVLAKQEQEEQDEEGNESDEWSEHDEIHYLPKETKAQFGNVRGCQRRLFARTQVAFAVSSALMELKN